jgi:hypothetical protein
VVVLIEAHTIGGGEVVTLFGVSSTCASRAIRQAIDSCRSCCNGFACHPSRRMVIMLRTWSNFSAQRLSGHLQEQPVHGNERHRYENCHHADKQ